MTEKKSKFPSSITKEQMSIIIGALFGAALIHHAFMFYDEYGFEMVNAGPRKMFIEAEMPQELG